MYSNTNNVISFASAQVRAQGAFEAPYGEVKTAAHWQGQSRAAIQSAALRRFLGTPEDCFYVTAAQLQERFNLTAGALRKIPISKLLRFTQKGSNEPYYLIADLARYLTNNPSCRTLKVGMFNQYTD